MRRTILLLFGLMLIFSWRGTAPAAAQDPIDFSNYQLDLVDYTLPNGLRVILAEDHSAPVVAVDIWYHVGGANDPQGRSGFAHLFEHMMFEGSANIGNDEYFALLEAIGANANAYTAIDQTAYWEVAPANELPRLLWMESDRMASLGVTQEAFDTQRQVVIEEFNQRVANRPYGVSGRRLFTQPFQGYLPYERSVIGSIEDLEAATLEEAQAFFETYYKPNNATLVIVGDIDVALTQALVQAYFGPIPAGEPVSPIVAQYPLPAEFPTLRIEAANGCRIGSEETLIDVQTQLPRFSATVVGPPRGAADFYALSLLADILGSGKSSRFEQNIVQTGQAAGAFLGLRDFLGASLLYSGIIPNADAPIEAAHDLIRAEFEAVIEEGVTESELNRVKTQVQVQTINSFRASVLDTAEWLQDAVLTFGDPNAIAEELAQYQAVTLEDVQRVAQTYLCDRPLNTLTTLPDGDEILTPYPGSLVEPVAVEPVIEPASPVLAFDSLDEMLAGLPETIVSRREAPTSLPIAESNFPPFETFSLDNGLTVIFVAQHEVPKVRLQLFIGGANPAAPADKQGVANLMADLLTKGTRLVSAAQIADTIESAGGSIGARAGLESVSLSLEAPTDQKRLAFHMLAHLIRFSNFPPTEFDLAQERTLTFLRQSEVEPGALANRQFGRVAFGEHPYGFYTSSETVANLSRADIVDFYKTFVKPNNALLVIVGDLTAAEARVWVERTLAAWQAGDVPDHLAYPEATTGDTSVIYLVDRPDSEQATLHVGNLAIDARNPDRYALTVTNAVLGSGASSRLFANLREDKGYTYGVASRFARPNDTGSFRVISDVNQDNAGDAIREILQELTTIRTEPIPETELNAAKSRLIGNFALAIEDPADFARQLASRHLSGIPLDELNTTLQSLSQVSAADARAAAAQYIESEQPIIVVVGNAEVLKPQLTKLGSVVVVDAEGNIVEGDGGTTP